MCRNILLFLVCLFTCLIPKISNAACEKPDILIILDRSGSMDSDGKWTAAKNAINFMTSHFQDQIRFGLELFATDDNCCVSAVQVALQDNAYTPISNAMNSTTPESWTPTDKAVKYAKTYYESYLPTDPELLRKHYVVVVTDGQANCGGSSCDTSCGGCNGSTSLDPTSSVAALRSVVAAGRTYDIKTYVIGFGAGVDAGQLQSMAQAGGTSSYYQADNQSSLEAALTNIADTATQEVCNGIDDDCDGEVDDGLTRNCSTICGSGSETCVNGVWQDCDARKPTDEICNNFDDDCNGRVDDGLSRDCSTICGPGIEECVDGNWVACTAQQPIEEVCNDFDDDCDGDVDDGNPGGGIPCNTGEEGICAAGVTNCIGGVIVCSRLNNPDFDICDGLDNDCDSTTEDGSQDSQLYDDCDTGLLGPCAPGKIYCENANLVCIQNQYPEDEVCDYKDNDCDGEIDNGVLNACGECGPVPDEVCDGFDNNCDGTIDEDCECIPGTVRECGNDEGLCETGLQTCAPDGLSWGDCIGTKGPWDEICDAFDNDCDGEIDEDCDCLFGDMQECGSDVGVCKKGVKICDVNGVWSNCIYNKDPIDEFCDCKDNDCDGEVDEGDLCSGGVCVACVCANACVMGECPSGFVCENGYCVPAQCENDDDCLGDLICDNGRCVNDCSNVECLENQECIMGNCIDTECAEGCSEGYICIDDFCYFDPCYEIECEENEFCRGGQCIDSCVGVVCGNNEVCIDGECIPDACFGVECDPGFSCKHGECIEDPCAGIECDAPAICLDGFCVGDPCLFIDCPEGEHCEIDRCVAGADADVDIDVDIDIDSDVDSDIDTDTDSDIDTDVDTDIDIDTDTDIDTDVDLDVDTDTDVDGENSDGCGCNSRKHGGIFFFILLGMIYYFFLFPKKRKSQY